MEAEKQITIIGGGASGTLLAIDLLQQVSASSVSINLVEKRESVGLGVAYSTTEDNHLLNVPAAKMGAFPDDVEHFHRWLGENGMSYAGSDFVPRKMFGEYLRSTLNKALREKPSNVNFRVIDVEAVGVDANSETGRVILDTGEALPAHKVVLAFGNALPPHPSVPDTGFITAPKYFQNPWSSSAKQDITHDDSVLIVGTGLSMVDMALRFYRAEHRGKVYAISTRGLLPAVHRLGFTYPSMSDELRPIRRITDLLKAVRRHIEKASADGSDWRAVIDALRPDTQAIWLNLPLEEKRYFLQHLSRYWNVSRHRMPPQAADILNEMQTNGRLTILKGRLKKIEWEGSSFHVEYSANGETHGVNVAAILNCIGSESNFEKIDSRLVKNLFARGYVRKDPLAFGLDALPDGTIIDASGKPSPVFHTLGTALKGVLWETTAIPEIRTQARDLAEKLLRS